MTARLAAAFTAAAALLLVACELAPGTAGREWPPPSPALWEVREGGRPVAYLFGTVHALPEGLEWRTPALERALAGADVLMVEIAELDDAGRAEDAFERVSDSPGLPPLPRRLPASARGEVLALIERADRDADDFAATETWAAALMLASATRRNDPAHGVERSLLDEAETVIGLETFADQFARFDRLSQTAQNQLLLAVAADARADTTGRIEAWLTGDLAALDRLAMGPIASSPELRETLVTGPNRAWGARIIRQIETGRRPFVAVGAGHMLGRDGLPALLARAGYKVRRLQ